MVRIESMAARHLQAKTFSPLQPAKFPGTLPSMSEPPNDPVLYASCSPELLADARCAAKANEQTLGGFIRLAVQKAIGKPADSPVQKKVLARRKRRA